MTYLAAGIAEDTNEKHSACRFITVDADIEHDPNVTFRCLRRFGGPYKQMRSICRADKMCRSNGVGMERSGMT
jgi:hypothetical protein